MPSTSLINTETERLRALHDYDLLDTLPEAAFDELVTLAARICGTPIAAVSLVARDRQWFKAREGLDLVETPRSLSFCAHAITRPDEIMIVPDAKLDARFFDNSLVTGAPGIRFYAGVPLKMPSGHALGSLCIIDHQPRTLSTEQQDALRVLARQVVSQIELRRTLALVQTDERNYRLLFEASPTPIIVYDIDTLALLAANPAAEAAYGYTLAEFLRLTKRDLRHADDLADLLEINALAPAVYHSPRSFRHRRKDGSIFPVAIHSHTLTYAGQRARLVLAVDMTEAERATAALHASEERFQLVTQATRDGIWDFDLVLGLTWWSDALYALIGLERSSAPLSQNRWREHIHPDDRNQVVQNFDAAVASTTGNWSAEYRFRTADGSYVNLLDRGRILRDATGRAVRVIGAASDITQRKQLEAQYLRAQRMESIGTLAGGIAHDLNNVLTPILMSIGLLKGGLRHDSESVEILNGIEASTKRGASLVRQVLSIARGFDGERSLINFRHLLLELERIARETFPHAIRVTVDCPRDLWTVPGDTTQLHQVLMNLALNARDAMPAGGTLTLSAANFRIDAQYASTSREVRPGNYVLIQVKDTGQGIPPEIIDRIFEPFFTTKSVGQGTGLGLSTVLAIVKSHAGFVQAVSEPGHGALFKIFLPSETLADVTAPPFESMAATLPRGKGELILVLDDENTIRTITQQTLEAFGYRVLTAANGAEGLALFAQQPDQIAAVITDLLMPIMDGTATIHALLSIRPRTRIIAASGLNTNRHAAMLAQAGFSDFLPKPYTAETMLRLLRTVLDRPAR